MTKTTTMSREEFGKFLLTLKNVHTNECFGEADVTSWLTNGNTQSGSFKLWSYIQLLLTSRDNEWRERIIRKAISVFRNEVGIEEFEWDGGESKIEDVVKKCLEQMEDK